MAGQKRGSLADLLFEITHPARTFGGGSGSIGDLLGMTPQAPPPPAAPPMFQGARPFDERGFQDWYSGMAQTHGLAPNPEEQFYDYRAAFSAGAAPDAVGGHWPSTYKRPGHPNEIVGGFNTRTGERVPGTRQGTVQELVALGWDEGFAKRNGRK